MEVPIHAPTRGATAEVSGDTWVSGFQFTRPRGARPGRPASPSNPAPFQFTRPRGARPSARLPPSSARPAFQFTRPRGARRRRIARRRPRPCFNSRAHEGRDLDGRQNPLRIRRFNSRAHEGRDLNVFPHSKTPCLFQFTRPRGARPGRRSRTLPIGRFQFTRPRGARLGIVRRAEDGAGVSIHAPTRGATAGVRPHKLITCRFNSRAHEGRDMMRFACTSASLFQFTRPRGARHEPVPKMLACYQFQFTRPRGARHLADRARDAVCTEQFQFTRPRGARQSITRAASAMR